MPKGYDKGIHAAIIFLNLFGLLMILSANMTSIATRKSLTIIFVKEIAFIVASYYIMVQAARNFSFKAFGKHYMKILIGIMGLLFLTMAFPSVRGARAWIRIGKITIQPSEFAKVFVILLMAYFLGDKQKVSTKVKSMWKLAKTPIVIVLIIVGFVTIAQKDLGSAVVIAGITYVVMLVPSNLAMSKAQRVMFTLLVIGLILMFWVTTPKGVAMIDKLPIPSYMIDRFRISANPFTNRYDNGYYQIFNGIVAFVKGGLLGVGYGKGFIKYSYLPEAENDAILAVVIEELGMIGFSFLLILYGIVIYRLLKMAFKVKFEKEKMVLVGTVAYIMIHFVFNVGGITALIPLTGVPLLFISAGGSSRMAIMLAIGLSQSVISRHKALEQKKVKHV
ncbi:FtsW/RodA/SpoVE family cell cycle protein [Erysipelothrix urinaevulpis]